MKSRLNQGLDHQLYFFRDQHGHEVDVIYKSANRCTEGFLIYSGDMEQTINETTLLNYRHAIQVING